MSDTTTPRGYFIIRQDAADVALSGGNAALRVLLALASFADNETGVCWPSRKTIAEKARLSVESVKRGLKELIGRGLIEVKKRRVRSSTVYTTRMTTVAPSGPSEDANKVSRKGVTRDPRGGSPVTPRTNLKELQPPYPPAEIVSADSVPDAREGDSLREEPTGAADAAAVDDGSAGWSERLDADRAAAVACPEVSSMTRSQADRLVAAAVRPGTGEAIIAPERLSKPLDADSLPLTPDGAESTLAALLGADFGALGAHGAYAADRVRRLAVAGDLTAKMIDQAITDASDARGVGATRLVAAVCRRLHAARLCARRTDMLNARRAARRAEDGDPVPAPRSAWLAPIIAAGGVLGEAENSGAYAALSQRVACPA